MSTSEVQPVLDDDERSMLAAALTDAVQGAVQGDLRGALARVGFGECLAADPATTVRTVFRLQGSALTSSSVLDDVLVAAAGLPGRAGAVLLPPLPATQPQSALGQDGLHISGVLDATAPLAHGLLVPALKGRETVLAVVAAPALPEHSPPAGMDLARSLLPYTATVAAAEAVVVGGPAEWQAVQAAGLRALSCELTGIADAMLQLAVDHTTTREQFGRPLAAFQAVKHKLADVRLWIEAADLAALSSFEDGDLMSAGLAKGLAVRATRTAREHCQQVLGGMGFSWEHPLHHYVRRALVLEPLLGGSTALRTDVGRNLLSTGQLPALAAL